MRTSIALVNYLCSAFGVQNALTSVKLQLGLVLLRLCFFVWINFAPLSNTQVPCLRPSSTVLDIPLIDLEFINKVSHLKQGEGKPQMLYQSKNVHSVSFKRCYFWLKHHGTPLLLCKGNPGPLITWNFFEDPVKPVSSSAVAVGKRDNIPYAIFTAVRKK